MTRCWICLLQVLAIVTTSCLGFTMDRPRIAASRNWSSPIFQIDRRASIEKILRDTEMRELMKLPDKKCCSEEPQRAKRSEDVLDTVNHSTIAEKIASESKKTTFSSSSSEPKNSKSTIESSATEMKNWKSTILSSATEMKTAEPTILSPATEIKTAESLMASSATEMKKWKSTILSSGTEMKTAVPAILSSASEVKTAESMLASSATRMKIPEITSEKSVNSDNPKNVVLLLIDNDGTGKKDFLKNFEASQKFPVNGILQNCGGAESPSTFSSGGPLVFEKKDEECDCERFLRANIESLLSWARRVKKMTIGAVSVTNFSIPLSLGYENPTSQLAKESEQDNEETNVLHQQFPRLMSSEPRDTWRSIDLDKLGSLDDKQSLPFIASPRIDSLSKREVNNGYDGMWDVFDIFSRIRMAFFRILLESLGNVTGSDDELNGKKGFTEYLQPNIVELVTDAIKELKSVTNDKGFVLVAAAPPGNELSTVIDVLRRQISIEDTLLVVTGICTPTNEPVSFFAHGPGEKSLYEARTIWDLPGSIRDAMTSGCVNESCDNNKKPEEPIASLRSLELTSMERELPARKRVGRATAEQTAEASESATIDEKSTKKPDEENEEDKMTPAGGKRSGASDIRADNVSKILEIVTSVVTMLALNSS